MIRLGKRSFRSYQALADWLADGTPGDSLVRLTESGIELGSGIYRTAFLFRKLKLVAKFTYTPRANRNEWKFYSKTPSWNRRFYAKPKAISKNGRILLMEYLPYVAPLAEAQHWRNSQGKHIHPKVLNDAYYDNVRKRTKRGPCLIVDYQTCFFEL